MDMKCLLPDAVLVQRLQHGLLALRGRLLVQVLEALPGRHAALGALLWHVQLPTEGQGPLGRVVDKQRRVAVMALCALRKTHLNND